MHSLLPPFPLSPYIPLSRYLPIPRLSLPGLDPSLLGLDPCLVSEREKWRRRDYKRYFRCNFLNNKYIVRALMHFVCNLLRMLPCRVQKPRKRLRTEDAAGSGINSDVSTMPPNFNKESLRAAKELADFRIARGVGFSIPFLTDTIKCGYECISLSPFSFLSRFHLY